MTLVAMGVRFDNEGHMVGLVAVCDRLLSNYSNSTIVPYAKIVRLGSYRLMGYAGDPGLFQVIKNSVSAEDADGLGLGDLFERVKASFSNLRLARIEDEILGSYGLKFPAFWTAGLASLGPHLFAEVTEQIRSYRLNLALLIGGYEPNQGWGGIGEITNPGVVNDQTVVGFGAIGSGSEIAAGHLSATYERHYVSSDFALARVLEAKFMSEAQRNVGRETVLMRLDPDRKLHVAGHNGIEAYRSQWEQRRMEIPQEWRDRLVTAERPI